MHTEGQKHPLPKVLDRLDATDWGLKMSRGDAKSVLTAGCRADQSFSPSEQ